ncbi:MAG TPA: ATP-dependent helicase HrpB, partial [Permianibacter sp.]|nr:ATP-dependent helicase HrpB [Permianibacter sp.]
MVKGRAAGLGTMALPIDAVLPTLLATLATSKRAVLSAAPGAGKTTRVPLALLEQQGPDADWLNGKQILMLEPRRLAAVRAAQYMAQQLGEAVGERVGYRIRGDSKVSAATRVIVVTEGILTRMLQDDPELSGVGIVLFDEFHERSLHADLGLALTLDVQDNLRDDLRVLVMSATLDGVAVAALLAQDGVLAPVVESQGRSFPVNTVYLGRNANSHLEPQVVSAIQKALKDETGDLLVFLPGQREIRRVQQVLDELALPEVVVHALFGEASPAQQQAALAPAAAGTRKIILATAIAETSLTIDGVRIVIDSGLARVARFDPVRGMSGLVTVSVSQATAEQRRGRAGRQQSGVCYRLWPESQHLSLPRFPTPELLSTDLTPFALELAQWGVRDVASLRLLDAPPAAHLQQARDLLRQLGALDDNDGLTAHGRALARLPVHPRYGHMLVRGKELGLGALACDVAALLEERDILRGADRSDVDLHTRWLALVHGGAVDRGARDRARQQAKRLRGMLQLNQEADQDEHIGTLLALAYPDRIGRQRKSGERSLRYQLASGIGASLPDGSALAREPYLAVAEVDGVGADAKIFLAAALPAEQLESVFGDLIVTRDEVVWDSREQCVVARRRRALGQLVFSEQTIEAEPAARTAALLAGVRQLGLAVLDWSGAALQFRTRSEWLRHGGFAPADWPDLSDAALLATLETWLAPFVTGLRTRAQLASVDLLPALKSLFDYSQQQELDKLAPTHLTVPTGSRIALDYSWPQPVLAVRIQEMFGERDTPRLAGGKAKVLIHLLAPGRQPLAVTQDLASFWQNA